MPNVMRKLPSIARRVNRLKTRAFTLVELLAVLAIISILIAITFMNTPSILGAAGFTQGGRLVLDTLNYARQNAVTQSVPTVVVVRTTGDHAWQRMAVFAAPVSASGASTWVQASQWQNMPSGAFINKDYNPGSEGWTSPANKLQDSPVAPPLNTIQDGPIALASGTDYYALGFLPDGSLQNTNNIALELIKGHLIGGAITPDASGDWIKLIIVQITGQVKQIRKGQ